MTSKKQPASKKQQKKPPIPFDDIRKEQFIKNLREHGFMHITAELTAVSMNTVNKHRKDDPNFSARVEEARQCWVDENLVKPAHERAVVGYDQPIIGGKDRDEVVAYKRVYSDSLLQTLLKGARPEVYGNQVGQAGAGGNSGGAMIMPAAPMTATDWQAAYGKLAKGKLDESGDAA